MNTQLARPVHSSEGLHAFVFRGRDVVMPSLAMHVAPYQGACDLTMEGNKTLAGTSPLEKMRQVQHSVSLQTGSIYNSLLSYNNV
jgi:hypothetical protein